MKNQTRISQFLYAKTSTKLVTLCLISYILFTAFIMLSGAKKIAELSGNPVEVLDLTVGYSISEFNAIVSIYSEEARHFAAFFTITADVVYPLVYGFLLSFWIALIFRPMHQKSGKWKNLPLFPFAIILVDLVENGLLCQLLYTFPNQSNTLVQIASILTQTKWSLLIICFLLIISGGMIRIKQKRA